MKQTKQGYIPENCTNLDHFPQIKGYDFNEKFDFNKFIKSYSQTGFQATNLGKAIHIIKAMIRENAKIYLAVTSNMITSGLREVIRYLVEHKLVHVLITSAGGIEEDIIKSIKPFALGEFNSNGKILYDKGINRTGNIFITSDRYTYFEKTLTPILDKAYKQQKEKGRPLCTSEIIDLAGKEITNKESVLHWTSKNKIPVFCPAITDGAFGDMIYFAKQKHKDFYLDITKDMEDIINLTTNAKKTGLIILGGGVSKHFTLNAQIFKEGADYAVYINTGNEYDGSDSGAKTDEAITWGKIKGKAPQVKVHGDASIIFPLVIAGVVNDLKP